MRHSDRSHCGKAHWFLSEVLQTIVDYPCEKKQSQRSWQCHFVCQSHRQGCIHLQSPSRAILETQGFSLLGGAFPGHPLVSKALLGRLF